MYNSFFRSVHTIWVNRLTSQNTREIFFWLSLALCSGAKSGKMCTSDRLLHLFGFLGFELTWCQHYYGMNEGVASFSNIAWVLALFPFSSFSAGDWPCFLMWRWDCQVIGRVQEAGTGEVKTKCEGLDWFGVRSMRSRWSKRWPCWPGTDTGRIARRNWFWATCLPMGRKLLLDSKWGGTRLWAPPAQAVQVQAGKWLHLAQMGV